ncbi:MAG TPA: twin-arginine translocation signal domain-containing protein, partial [Candidatus Angelobacter sp.]|nr:twin-arginine translocation signal domain-containing protein [Candidatus Angelobacter sp.]
MANQSNGNPPEDFSQIRPTTNPFNRRSFLAGAAAGAATLAMPRWAHADAGGFFSSTYALAPALLEEDQSAIRAEITKRHDETVQRLQTWMKQPSIAAENRGMNEGCEFTMQMLREAGFQQVTKVPTDGQPGIFATLDAGAPKTLGLYFMYDVKQVDPSEWSSPPWDAKI